MRFERKNNMLSKELAMANARCVLLRIARLLLCLVAIAATLMAQQAGSNNKSAGVLYVVDSDNLHRNSRVLAVDIQHKTIIRTYSAPYHPDIAISPDGKRLYLSYDTFSSDRSDRTGTLQVIDTATGKIIASLSHPRRVYTNDDDTVSYMAISPDGHWLYIFEYDERPDGSFSYGIAVFDTTSNRFLPDMVAMPDCDFSRLFPWPDSSTLTVVCGGTKEVRTVRFNAQGVPTTRLPAGMSIVQSNKPIGVGIATAFLTGNAELTIVFGDGSYSRINLPAGKIVQQDILAFSPPLNPQITLVGEVWMRTGRFVGVFDTPVWNGKVFLVLAKMPDYNTSGLADAIAVFDANTLQQENFIEPGAPFSDLTVGPDGTMFIVDSKSAAIHVLALPNGREKGEIEGLGKSPTVARFAAN